MLPDAFLNELKYRCNAEEVIGGYVNLKRKGRYMTGLCPFHSEKSPSFTVYTENQSFFCFGCGTGGDIITFIRKIENISYIEAVRMLAQRVGMELPEEADDGSHRMRLRIQEMNREAARFFHRQLMGDAGKAARGYLARRGMTRQMVTKFGLGFAPDGWPGLSEHLRGLGYNDDELIAAALAGRSKNGGLYDVFRNRVIFPIIDLRGGVIGFGGRVMEGNGPKYLNSSDTMVFKKSRNLFALNLAKNSKRKQLLMAEGYMDVISIYQAGFDNAVATLGTALTDEQARIIAGYTNEVVLAYDSDGPGQTATKRAIDILDRVGVTVRILSMDGAKDPDEYIKKYGAQRFELLVDGSKSALDFEMAKLNSKHDTSLPEGRVAFLGDFVRLMANTPNPVQREVYMSKVCRDLEIDRQVMVTQVNDALKKRERVAQKRERSNLKPFTDSQTGARVDYKRQKNPREALAAERLIAYLYKNPEQAEWLDGQLREEMIVSDIDLDIYRLLRTRALQKLSLDMMTLCGQMDDDRINRLSEIAAAQSGRNVTRDEALECVQTLQRFAQTKSVGDIGSMDDDEVARLIASISAAKVKRQE